MSAALSKSEVHVPRAKPLGPIHPAPHKPMLPAPRLRGVCLVADLDEELETTALEREFPTVTIERAEQADAGDLVIDDFAWRGAFEFGRFDELVAQSRSGRIAIRGSDAAGVAVEVLARYQRWIGRRNEAASTALFDAVLEAHAALFAADCELDHAHALDTWQWLLRLDPHAGFAVQLAALFHEVDRLGSEAQERLEHRAHRAVEVSGPPSGRPSTPPDPRRIPTALEAAGVDARGVRQVCELVAGAGSSAAEAQLLDDADTLSFLSLISPPYADHFGLAQTRRKVTFMLGRLGTVAREKVTLFRFRPDIGRLLQRG